jgi:hypothetical protein
MKKMMISMFLGNHPDKLGLEEDRNFRQLKNTTQRDQPVGPEAISEAPARCSNRLRV